MENDYGGDQDQPETDPVSFLRRRAAAYQAYYEHMPLRRSSLPVGPQMQLYRSLDWGRLAQFQLVDTRQHRPRRTCEALADGSPSWTAPSVPTRPARCWAPRRSAG